MMLTQFPIPYPDELLYSILARYTAHMRFASANIYPIRMNYSIAF